MARFCGGRAYLDGGLIKPTPLLCRQLHHDVTHTLESRGEIGEGRFPQDKILCTQEVSEVAVELPDLDQLR